MTVVRRHYRALGIAVKRLAIEDPEDGETTEEVGGQVDGAPRLAQVVEGLQVFPGEHTPRTRDREWGAPQALFEELWGAPMLVLPRSGDEVVILGSLDGQVVVGVAVVAGTFVVVRRMRKAYGYEESWFNEATALSERRH